MTTIELIYQHFKKGSRIVIDSREIKDDDIFIAIKGSNFDANTFAQKAIELGAKFAIVDDNTLPYNEKYVYVQDSIKFLQELANHHRRKIGIPILAITGTNGKTTTKELCHTVLSKKFNTLATEGNLNNHIGVPLTLLKMDESTEFAIIEMGANHMGEIHELCKIAEPNYGIITNIGHAHLEGFGSFENIIKTKNELYNWLKPVNGTIFVNGNDELLCKLSENMKRFTYGTENTSLTGQIAQNAPYLVYAINTPKGQLYIKTKLIGGYNFANAMAATSLGIFFKIDHIDIKDAIEDYTPSNLRSQLIKNGSNTIILDAYNANPSSMEVAIGNFKMMNDKNKIMILGEMRELGETSREAHKKLIDLALQDTAKIFLIGKEFDNLYPNNENILFFSETEELIEYLKNNKFTDATFLVKGSRANKLENIVEYL